MTERTFSFKKISVVTLLNKDNLDKIGWLISDKIYKELSETRYTDKCYRLSEDSDAYNLIRIVDYTKIKKRQHPVKEVLQYVNTPRKALVILRYLQVELIKKGIVEIEYKVSSHRKTMPVYIFQ